MFVTAVAFAKKPKSRFIMVLMESLTSGHKKVSFRDKVSDVKEILGFDPNVQMMSVYREVKKVRTMRGSFDCKVDCHTPTFDKNGNVIPPVDREIYRSKKRRIPTLD